MLHFRLAGRGQSASSRTPGRHDTRRQFPLSCHGLSFPFAKWLKAKPPALGLIARRNPPRNLSQRNPPTHNEHPPVGGSTLNVMNITSVLHRPVQHRHKSPNWCMSWIVQFQPARSLSEYLLVLSHGRWISLGFGLFGLGPTLWRTIPLNLPRRCRSGARSSKDCGSSRSVATRPTLSPGLATETCGSLART